MLALNFYFLKIASIVWHFLSKLMLYSGQIILTETILKTETKQMFYKNEQKLININR